MSELTTARWRVHDLGLGRPLAMGGEAVEPGASVLVAGAQLLEALVSRSGDQTTVDHVSWRVARGDGHVLRWHSEVVGRRTRANQRKVEVDVDVRLDGESGPLAKGTCTLVVTLEDVAFEQYVQNSPLTFNGDAWIAALVEELSTDATFSDVTSAFDGSIAFSFGSTSLALRVYRGRVIDRGRHLVSGATFSVGATPATWLAFARRPRNEFISFAMGDHFEVRGSTYDYLRMTGAVMTATDLIRRRLGEELGHHA